MVLEVNPSTKEITNGTGFEGKRLSAAGATEGDFSLTWDQAQVQETVEKEDVFVSHTDRLKTPTVACADFLKCRGEKKGTLARVLLPGGHFSVRFGS